MVAVGQVKGPSKVLVTKLRLEELSSRMVNGFCFQCLAPSLAVTWTDRVQAVFLRRHPPLSGCHLQILRSVYLPVPGSSQKAACHLFSPQSLLVLYIFIYIGRNV